MKPNQKKFGDETFKQADTAMRRAREAIKSSARTAQEIDRKSELSIPARARDFMENIGIVAETIRAVKAGFTWINNTVVQPIRGIPFVGPALIWPFKAYFQSYYKFTHPYEGETLWQATKNSVFNVFRRGVHAVKNYMLEEDIPFPQDLRIRGPLSAKRAGIAALATMWTIAGMFKVPIAGDSFNYFIKEPILDGTRMAATVVFNGVAGNGFGLSHDNLYFGVPSKEPGDDLYHVNASTEQHASESNSVSFQIENRLLHEIWSWTNGHGPFRPDYVVAPIRPDSNKCDVTYYGARWRLARWASVRPQMLSVECHAPAPPIPALPALP